MRVFTRTETSTPEQPLMRKLLISIFLVFFKVQHRAKWGRRWDGSAFALLKLSNKCHRSLIIRNIVVVCALASGNAISRFSIWLLPSLVGGLRKSPHAHSVPFIFLRFSSWGDVAVSAGTPTVRLSLDPNQTRHSPIKWMMVQKYSPFGGNIDCHTLKSRGGEEKSKSDTSLNILPDPGPAGTLNGISVRNSYWPAFRRGRDRGLRNNPQWTANTNWNDKRPFVIINDWTI